MTALYRMHDAEPCGVFPVAEEEAPHWNSQGFGIFWTVNRFRGPRRIENLERIEAWAIDMDAGSKAEQAQKLNSSPVVPSLVVETRRGYQAYWRAKDASPAHWNAIVLERLVPYFGADKNARDIARILRVPGFYHVKDPANPFLVRIATSWDVAYTEDVMLEFFPHVPDVRGQRGEHAKARAEYKPPDGDDFWERVFQLDCAEGLARLSGHHAVNGERFTFRRNASGTQNILVNGKGTSCWVDRNGRIGSLAKGGPTLYQWLRWYRNTPAECARVIKEIFPQLAVVKR